MLNSRVDGLARVNERLSSGQRINRASDDVAGLAIASDLNLTSRVTTTAIRNFNDGTSLLNIASGALDQLSSLVTRLSELAATAANGSYSTSQRSSLDAEAQALRSEYSRVVSTTTFNGQRILDFSQGTVRLQGGIGLEASLEVSLGQNLATTYQSLGTFSAATTFALGAEIFEINSSATGDFNGDGNLDIIANGDSGEGLAVFLGNGDGSFKTRVSYPGGGDFAYIVTGDLNGDGITDVTGLRRGFTANMFDVRLGNGDGSFRAPVTYVANGGLDNISDAALYDFDGDGDLDFVSTSYNEGTLNINLGNGNGTFQARTSILSPGHLLREIGVADFNGDGRGDIVTMGGGDSMYILIGNGNGTFNAAVSYFVHTSGANDLVVGDFNGDGKVDIFTNLGVLHLGNGNGTFSRNDVGSSVGTSFLATDFNQDGVLDIVGKSAGNNLLRLHIGNGNGTFKAPLTYSMDIDADMPTTGDFNNDGIPDVALTSIDGAGYLSVVLTNSERVGGLGSFSLLTQEGARSAMTAFSQAQVGLGKEIGIVGSFQSRVAVALNNMTNTLTAVGAAHSRIIDADVAAEAAESLRLRIGTDIASMVLAQANQTPAFVLTLLNFN